MSQSAAQFKLYFRLPLPDYQYFNAKWYSKVAFNEMCYDLNFYFILTLIKRDTIINKWHAIQTRLNYLEARQSPCRGLLLDRLFCTLTGSNGARRTLSLTLLVCATVCEWTLSSPWTLTDGSVTAMVSRGRHGCWIIIIFCWLDCFFLFFRKNGPTVFIGYLIHKKKKQKRWVIDLENIR